MLKQKLYITILKRAIKPLIAIAISFGVAFFIGGEISKITKTIAERRTAALFLEKRIETITNIKNEFSKIGDENQRKLEEAIPSSDDLPDIISSLEALAAENQIKPFSIRFDGNIVPTVKSGGLSIAYASFSINMNASTASVIKYLRALESLPYFAQVTTIGINNTISAKGLLENNSQAQITGRVYIKQN